MEIVQGVTGVLIGMLDKKYGLIKFNRGTETCIALFSMDALFKDGYPYRKFFINKFNTINNFKVAARQENHVDDFCFPSNSIKSGLIEPHSIQ